MLRALALVFKTSVDRIKPFASVSAAVLCITECGSLNRVYIGFERLGVHKTATASVLQCMYCIFALDRDSRTGVERVHGCVHRTHSTSAAWPIKRSTARTLSLSNAKIQYCK